MIDVKTLCRPEVSRTGAKKISLSPSFTVSHINDGRDYYLVKKSSFPYCIVSTDLTFWDVDFIHQIDVAEEHKEAILSLVDTLKKRSNV